MNSSKIFKLAFLLLEMIIQSDGSKGNLREYKNGDNICKNSMRGSKLLIIIQSDNMHNKSTTGNQYAYNRMYIDSKLIPFHNALQMSSKQIHSHSHKFPHNEEEVSNYSDSYYYYQGLTCGIN
jgi:hypothetical protein